MEYRRSLIADFIYLYNAIIDNRNLPDVLERIKGLPPQNKRRVDRMLAGIIGFLREPGIDEIENKDFVEYALPYFKSIIENWSELFNKFANDNILDGTGCTISRGTAFLRGSKFETGIYNCKKHDIRCKIIEFYTHNRNDFNKILEALSDIPLDEEQEKIKMALEKAIENPQNMADIKNCRRCGDAIIAVECPDDFAIFTKNEKHFSAICKKIDKKLLIY